MATRRRSLGTKITLVAATYTLPIAVLLYFVVTNINYDLRFSTLEVAGNAYQRPLESLLDAVGEHRLLVSRGQTEPADAERARTLAVEVDEAFEDLAAADARYGVDLQFTTEGLGKRDREGLTVNAVRSQWQAIVERAGAGATSPASAAALQEQYDELLASVRGMITHAGDTSNLILDPDLDSYYLMDVTLLALPQTQDRLTRVIQFAGERLAAGPIAPEDRVQLLVDAALLEEADLARTLASAETSLNEDANFYGVSPTLASTLEPALDEYRAANEEFIARLRQLGSDAPQAVAPAAFVEAGTKARRASFELWNASVQELDRLLDARIASHRHWLVVTLVGSGIAWCVAACLAFAIQRSITAPLKKVAESLRPGADLLANCVQMIVEAPEDSEVISEELTAHIGYLRRAVQDLTVLVHGGEARPTAAAPAPSLRRELAAVGTS